MISPDAFNMLVNFTSFIRKTNLTQSYFTIRNEGMESCNTGAFYFKSLLINVRIVVFTKRANVSIAVLKVRK
jgi:hypothetical protein